MSSPACTELEASVVLAALYNNAKPLGVGKFQYTPNRMTQEEASDLLKLTKSFDYILGKPMKIHFKYYPIIDTWLYDRDQPISVKDIILSIKNGGI